jgi:hypothetical protein
VTHSEITASSNVAFYGLKYETRLSETALRRLMDITNSHKISIFGGSGLYDGSRNSTNSVFKITDSDGIFITNTARTLTYQADEKWVDNIENGTTIDSVASSDRSPLVLYKTAEKPSISGGSEDGDASSDLNGAANSDANGWTAAYIIGLIILLAGLVAAVFWFRCRSNPRTPAGTPPAPDHEKR